MSSPGKGDEGSENKAFEDPLCSSIEIPFHPWRPGYADEPTYLCGRVLRRQGRLYASVQTRPVHLDG
jgi:hypothetical protein